MARTDIDKVSAILPDSSGLSGQQIEAAIDAATCLVDQAADSCASRLTEECLIQVETYLAAHFAAVTENTLSLKSEKDACGSQVTYGFEFGKGVKGTPFGQTANMLSGGCLAEFDKTPIGLFSIGSL